MSRRSRWVDVVAAGVALTGFAPVLGLAAVWIRLDDGGPILFVQERVGLGGQPLRVFKLRTMSDGTVTRPGRWLRPTGIDEVPQFINVLMGDMGVVGPRPWTLADAERYGAETWRTTMRPGITGPAQLLSRTIAEGLTLDRELVDGGRSVRSDVRWIGLSFGVNVVGKARVRRWLGIGARMADRS